MHRKSITYRVLAGVALLLILQLTTCAPTKATESVAIIVYDHGLAKQVSWAYNGNFVPINKTTSFTQDDKAVWAYFTAALSNANVTWQWYDPNGALFLERTDHEHCSITPCTFIYYFDLPSAVGGSKFGVWRMDLAAGGSILYTDHFSVSPVILQDNRWSFNIEQSVPFRVRGHLAVTIYPNNGTWGSYTVDMGYAANFTAYDAVTNRTLRVTANKKTGSVLVDLGAARPGGFTFVLSFDVKYGWQYLESSAPGDFAFSWVENFYDPHPIPQTFNITLPQRSQMVDLVGYNAMDLNSNLTEGPVPSISFSRTALGRQPFGWSLIYRDHTWLDLNAKTLPSTIPKTLPADLSIPILPLKLSDVSLWSAVMSALLLTCSELLSPLYAGRGILINRRRLRIVALIIVMIFIATTGYRLLALSQSVTVTR